MKKSVAYLGFSTICLVIAGLGLNLQALATPSRLQALPSAPSASAVAAPATNKADAVDLVGLVGDEVMSACNTSGASCDKSWQALGKLADQKSL